MIHIYIGIDVDEHAIKEAKKKKTGVNFRYEDLFKLEIDRTRRQRKFIVLYALILILRFQGLKNLKI